MRPKRSVVDRVVPSEPSAPRTVVRLRVIGALVAVVFSLMFVRLWYLQVLDTKSFAQTVNANQLRQVEVPAARGLILDRSGSTLVGNQVTEDITLSRVSAQQHPEVVGQLASLLGTTPAQIQADLSNPQYSLYKPVPIMDDAPMSDVLYIGEHSSQFPGVSTVAETARTYPMCPTNPPGQCETGAQMLGYVGQISQQELAASKKEGYQLGDQYGQSGLENQYQSALRGVPGVQDVEVNAQGEVVGTVGQTNPSPGDDVITNIDSGLEQTLQQDLAAQIQQVHGVNGAAIVMNPQTGAVLALVSSPTYNPTWWTNDGISEADYQALEDNGGSCNNPSLPEDQWACPLSNYAIEGVYTPGSTFKLATASAALNEGLITPDFSYYDSGTYTLGNTTFHDNEGEGGYDLNVTSALTVSSDDFFYNLGVMFWDARGQYGEDAIENEANALGYGTVTGIDIPGEAQGIVDSPQVAAKEHAQYPTAYPDGGWYAGNNLELAFGQGGTEITPIEQAVAYSTFANGGTRYEPQIAAGLFDPATCKVVKTFAPKATGHVGYSPTNYQAMLQGFEGAVNDPSGTAYGDFTGFPLSTFPIAGKTGTATEPAPVEPNSWFVGWGPLPNPQYLVAAVIQGGGYGSEAAAPVVRNAFNYIVANPAPAVSLTAPSGTCLSSPKPSSSTTHTHASATRDSGAHPGGSAAAPFIDTENGTARDSAIAEAYSGRGRALGGTGASSDRHAPGSFRASARAP
jgi:penicillin-binding protein 2